MRIDKLLSGEEVNGASWRLAGGKELVGRDGYSSGKAVVPRWWRILLGWRMLLALLLCFDLAFRGLLAVRSELTRLIGHPRSRPPSTVLSHFLLFYSLPLRYKRGD